MSGLVVDELEEPQYNLEAYRKRAKGQKDQTSQKYPENYETCMNFFGLSEWKIYIYI